ncbi:trypsin-like peptidase domain-containing protein [Hamadaea sp. NPDC050747]|uniref:S1C family serine protease n=1 Tax=Hamadaea sp. NPDC050747 TaxID=3155789 RepID=UPI0034043E9C
MTDGWNWRQPDDDDAAERAAASGDPESPTEGRTDDGMWADQAWSDPQTSATWTAPPVRPAEPAAGHWWSDARSDPWRDPSAPVSLTVPGHTDAPATDRVSDGGWFTRRTAMVAALVIAAALVAGVMGGALGVGFVTAARRPTAALSSSNRPIAALAQRPPQSFAAIAARVLPSVVTVRAQIPGGTALGSGFAVGDGTYIITNDHVVSGGSSLSVVLNDGSSTAARLLGSDPESDVAVLRVPKSNLQPLELGDSTTVQVGDPVLAVGSPLALPGTVTSGIVSAVDRLLAAGDPTLTRYYAAIQTDAAINHGNSGGPLLDGAGEVVGINSVIKSMATDDDSAGNIGLAFAIPINQAKRIAEEIIAHGRARRTVIGARLDDAFRGVRVAQVDPAGPAADAGMKDGDVIISLDGHAVSEPVELIALVRKYPPGSAVTVRYQRGSDRKDVTVTLAADAK